LEAEFLYSNWVEAGREGTCPVWWPKVGSQIREYEYYEADELVFSYYCTGYAEEIDPLILEAACSIDWQPIDTEAEYPPDDCDYLEELRLVYKNGGSVRTHYNGQLLALVQCSGCYSCEDPYAYYPPEEGYYEDDY
jgi:hypothetical protein